MLPLLASLALAAGPGAYAVVQVTGVDDCCAQKLVSALDDLPFVDGAAVSWQTNQACVRLSGELDAAAVSAVVTGQGYQFGGATVADACPAGLSVRATDPWQGITGLDLAHVSKGEAFDLEGVRAAGKFTIVDFGASWCGPCFTAADRIAAYARKNPDVAVRAVLLAGADAKESFAQPAAKQHLQFAEGLPYFVAYGPTGKKVFQGSDVDSLLSAIDRKRK